MLRRLPPENLWINGPKSSILFSRRTKIWPLVRRNPGRRRCRRLTWSWPLSLWYSLFWGCGARSAFCWVTWRTTTLRGSPTCRLLNILQKSRGGIHEWIIFLLVKSNYCQVRQILCLGHHLNTSTTTWNSTTGQILDKTVPSSLWRQPQNTDT